MSSPLDVVSGIDFGIHPVNASGIMTKKAKPPKHADFSQLAKAVVDRATDETEELPESAAVKRGQSGGTKGGASRARKLSADRRSEIAKKAAIARWKKS